MTDADLLLDVLRAVLAGCTPYAGSPQHAMEAGAATLAAAKKAKATAHLPGVQYLAKRFTPRNATLGWAFGGGDLVLQTCLRAPCTTGLPQAAEALLRDCDHTVLVPRRRLDTELDKAGTKARCAPHDYTTGITVTADGQRAITVGNGTAAAWRLADGELDAVYGFGRVILLTARVLPDGRIVALGVERTRQVGFYTHTGVKHRRLYELGDVNVASISPDGRFVAGAVERRGDPGAPDDTSHANAEGYELRVWDAATGAPVAGVFTPHSGTARYYPCHAWHPDGRLFVGAGDRVRVLAAESFAVAAQWPISRVPQDLALSPDGSRLLVGFTRDTVTGETPEPFPVLDTRTGEVLATVGVFGQWMDEDTLVEATGYTVRLVRLDGRERARMHCFNYVIAACGPHGEVIVGAAAGSNPGIVEVFLAGLR